MISKLIVMQPLDLCNLNCKYCYLPGRKNPQLMSDAVLAASFNTIFKSTLVTPIDSKEVLRVAWHSGEPMLAGLPFFHRAKLIQDSLNLNHIPITWVIQTNATRVDRAWCEFIKTHKIEVGVSIDGPEALHDHSRVNWNNKGSFKQAMRGVKMLREHNIQLNAICVLTLNSLNYPEEIYQFFKAEGFNSLGFNVDEQEGQNTQSSLGSSTNLELSTQTQQKYALFLSKVYDLWDADRRILNIREFNRAHQTLNFRKTFGFNSFLPNSENTAFNIISISKDGDVTTFSPELATGSLTDPKHFVIGNVCEIESLDELLKSDSFRVQLAQVKRGVELCKRECEYFSFCGGGSPSNKFYENGSFATTQTSFCALSQKVLCDTVISKLQ